MDLFCYRYRHSTHCQVPYLRSFVVKAAVPPPRDLLSGQISRSLSHVANCAVMRCSRKQFWARRGKPIE